MHNVDVAALWYYEREALSRGYRTVAGIDEAGRGPLAGPVVAAAVVLPLSFDTDGIYDSKQISEKKREAAFEKIMNMAHCVGVGVVEPQVIDRINILQATYSAMRAAVGRLAVQPDFCLVDGYPIQGFEYPQNGIVDGDCKSVSIAAASIIAKVTRDRIMCEYDRIYPQYGFSRHKGYPTPEHIRMLSVHGVCEIHRRSFAPVSEELNLLWEVS
jgi:ribonuclease HII